MQMVVILILLYNTRRPRMTIETPEFQGTHLWDRLCWAKEKLEPYRTEYCVVWEDPETPDEPAKDYTS